MPGVVAVAESDGRLRIVTLLRRDLQRRWSELADDPRLEVIAASNGHASRGLFKTSSKAVLLVDARVIDNSAFDIAAAHAADPAPIVVAAPSARVDAALSYVSAGAAGCVLTAQPVAEVADALQAAAAGALVAPPDLMLGLILVLTEGDPPAPVQGLRGT
jgi:DNA-binding NarL/FixJ family response regulator